jgi:hypothetical protein
VVVTLKTEILTTMITPFGFTFSLLAIRRSHLDWRSHCNPKFSIVEIIITFILAPPSTKIPLKGIPWQTASTNGAHESNSTSTKWTSFLCNALIWCALSPHRKSHLIVGNMATNCATMMSTFLVFKFIITEYGICPAKMEKSCIPNRLWCFHFPFSRAISFIFLCWEFCFVVSSHLPLFATMNQLR